MSRQQRCKHHLTNETNNKNPFSASEIILCLLLTPSYRRSIFADVLRIFAILLFVQIRQSKSIRPITKHKEQHISH